MQLQVFNIFSKWAARMMGRPTTFVLALSILIIWAITGPIYGYSDTWQLVINTGTSVVTFLMVFLIQNTQNRDSAAMQVKLDELIRISQGAQNGLLDLEDLSEADILELKAKYCELAADARREGEPGAPSCDTGQCGTASHVPDIKAPATLSQPQPIR